VWCVAVLLLTCGKKISDAPTNANGNTKASSADGDSGATEGKEEATATSMPELKLDCSELGPDVPVVDEQPGPGVPRIAGAGSNEPPEGGIAYESEGKIWIVSSTGQRRKRLVTGKGPRWFPGGRSLLFVSDLGDHLPRLFEASVDCSSVRVLTRPMFVAKGGRSAPDNPYENGIFFYSLGPDGKHIAFTRDEHDIRNLYVLDLATETEQQLAKDVWPTVPAWFPDNQTLAYVTGDMMQLELTSIDIVTGQIRKLAAVNDPAVAVTPDSRLIFHSAVGASFDMNDRQARLYQTELTHGAVYALRGSELAPGAYGDIRISPNGAKLAVSWALWTGNGPAAVRDHGIALFALPKSLPPASTRAANPLAWGHAVYDPKTSAITFRQPKTRNLTQSASGERYRMSDPSWASDNRHLVFGLEYCGQDFIECRSQIVAVDSAAANPQLTFLANGSDPVWAP
jgi:hypothetical protein